MNTVGWLAVLGLVGVCGVLLWRAFLIEPYALKVERRTIGMKRRETDQPGPSADEPSDRADGPSSRANGLRILHITDLHLKGIGELQWQLIREARALRPDVIAVTGDFLSDGRALTFLAPLLMELGQVAPIYAVLGDQRFRRRESSGAADRGIETQPRPALAQ